MDEEFLVSKELHKSFNEHKAVDGVSFTIYKGEIFGFLGPNGAGKTTTIRMLSTVLEPDKGDVTVGGHSIKHDADAVRALIGVCPQELALYEDLSALDNMVFFGRMVGLGGKEAKAQALQHLKMMGLDDRTKQTKTFFNMPEGTEYIRYASLDPEVEITNAAGEVVAEGKMPFG